MLIRFALQSTLLCLFAVALSACSELKPLPSLWRDDARVASDANSAGDSADGAPTPDVQAPVDAPDVSAPDVATADTQPDAAPDGSVVDVATVDVQPDATEPVDAAPDAPPVDVLPPPDVTAPPDVVTCSSGFERCDGVCVDTFTATEHCGACGHACALPNGVAVCRSATCALLRCAPGFANCDGDASNGCEVDTRTSREHCGVCGSSCTAFAHVCAGGACLEDHGFQPVAPCLRESDYVRGATVTFGVGGYSPRCLRVSRGASVTFVGTFRDHPMLALEGNGTRPSPLGYTPSGSQESFVFSVAGYFPFGCTLHPSEGGVVWVE